MLKKYKPSKWLSYLYFIFPLFLVTKINVGKESDIWFLLSYGKKIITSGFHKYDFLSMHENFSFVMQQWLSALSFYQVYKLLGGVGLFLLVFIINALIIFFLYKLCMLLSDNKVFSSVITTCIIDILLQSFFIIPRPQIYSLLLFIITIYILELYLKKNSKFIYLLPLISLLLINFHASMWLCLFILTMPFIFEFTLLFIKKKDKRIVKLLLMLLLSFLVGILNPYGIKNMFYSLTSYGVDLINREVIEMHSFTIMEPLTLANYCFIGTFFILLIGIIYHKNRKVEASQLLLILGTTYMALCNFRNISIFYVCALPFLSIYLPFQDGKEEKIPVKLYILFIAMIVLTISMNTYNGNYNLKNTNQKYINYLNKNENKEIKLYAGYNDGSYFEFSGYHPYIDGRAEIFLKSNNKKEDILDEYFSVYYGKTDIAKFLEKYDFDYLVIGKDSYFLYNYLKTDKNYQVVVKSKNKKMYKRIRK